MTLKRLRSDLVDPLLNAWNQFWFESYSPEKIKYFRIIFGTISTVFYCIRMIDLEMFYSEQGILPMSSFEDVMSAKARYTLLLYVTSTPALYVIHSVLILSLILMTIGVLPRLMALIAFVIQVSFLHRNLSVAFGADYIGMFYLFYLCLMLPWKSSKKSNETRSIPQWDLSLRSAALRFSQIQLCVIYFYSGTEKLKGQMWWKGEALWQVLANPQLARYDFWWTHHFSFFLILMTYLTLVWELFFTPLVWVKPLRKPMLVFGVGFHFMIAFTIRIPFFSLIMISTYLLFLEPQEIESYKNYAKRKTLAFTSKIPFLKF